MSDFVIDGQRPKHRPAPMEPITLRSLGPAPQLSGVEAIEVSMSMWLEEDGWQDTLKMDLTELRG